MATPAQMPNVFWLGGGCGSGKTTIARVLTRLLDLRLYPVDGYAYAHGERSKRDGFPLNRAVAEMTPEQRWDRTPAELAEWFAAVAAERLEMVLADLRGLGPGPTVATEGPQLFPDLIAPLMQTPEHGLWLLPTPEFGQHGVAGRRAGGLTGEAAQRRRDRDVLLTEINRRQVRQHGLPSADVEGTGRSQTPSTWWRSDWRACPAGWSGLPTAGSGGGSGRRRTPSSCGNCSAGARTWARSICPTLPRSPSAANARAQAASRL